MRNKKAAAKNTALADAVRELVDKKKQEWSRYVGNDAQKDLKSDAFPYIGAIPIRTFWNARGDDNGAAEEKALADLIAAEVDPKKAKR